MNIFAEIDRGQLEPGLVKRQVQTQGYVLVRGLLDKRVVESAVNDVTEVLSRAGWLQPGVPAKNRIPLSGAACGDPDPEFKRVYQQVFNLELLHRLPHQSTLREVMEILVGKQVLIHPKPIARLIFPQCEQLVTHAHQDYEFMGGDPEFYTVWIPLHDCPVETGPLRILQGSHLHGIQRHQSEGLHVPEIPEGEEAGDEWVGGRVDAGDVLIFHSLTVHAASPNLSGQMRLSMDCRFQDARRMVNPANLVFAGESGKSWERTYAGWNSDELKYYWKKMKLTLQPSKDELEQLAETAQPAARRARYSRMISQLA